MSESLEVKNGAAYKTCDSCIAMKFIQLLQNGLLRSGWFKGFTVYVSMEASPISHCKYKRVHRGFRNEIMPFWHMATFES